MPGCETINMRQVSLVRLINYLPIINSTGYTQQILTDVKVTNRALYSAESEIVRRLPVPGGIYPVSRARSSPVPRVLAYFRHGYAAVQEKSRARCSHSVATRSSQSGMRYSKMPFKNKHREKYDPLIGDKRHVTLVMNNLHSRRRIFRQITRVICQRTVCER